MICVPTLSQEVGAALGAQVGKARFREVVGAGGFQSMRVNGVRVATLVIPRWVVRIRGLMQRLQLSGDK